MISTGGSTEAKDGPDAEVPVGEVKVVNNLDWTKDVSLIDFLRTVGKMARVNVMMARDRYIPSYGRDIPCPHG
jgi:tyrosyl-tRNA synthetase